MARAIATPHPCKINWPGRAVAGQCEDQVVAGGVSPNGWAPGQITLKQATFPP